MPPDVMSATQPLLQVEDLKVHFPLPAAGLLRKSAGAVKAVDGVSFTLAAGVSSIKMLVPARTLAASSRIGHSSSCSWPSRSRWLSIPVSIDSRRCASCSLLISKLKIATRAL